MDNNEILFTTAGLLDFLQQIDELSDKNLSLDATNPSAITVVIGDSTYSIPLNGAEDVEAPEEVVDEVSDIADEAWADMVGAVEISELGPDEEVVEGGIISEALKTLAVGGLVRLTGKILGKDVADSLLK